jgi:hypothetical protein
MGIKYNKGASYDYCVTILPDKKTAPFTAGSQAEYLKVFFFLGG